ncbi:MAG: alpha/beta fold hydrolase [Actinomycetota bacterium]
MVSTLRPPPRWAIVRELRAGQELLRLGARTPTLRRTRRGDGGPVVVVPGFGATDLSLLPLRRFLAGRGHAVSAGGFGRMDDDVETNAEQLAERVDRIARRTGRTVGLVGWSIGGVVAREAARDRPDLVRHVVTFGTPVEGGPAYTSLARTYSADRLAEIGELVEERYRTPIEVPVTAIWSRRDGIVSADACIDRRSPEVEHVEVASSHLGMGLDPDVWAVTADRLAT